MLIQIAEFRPDEWLSPDVRMAPGKKWEVIPTSLDIELKVAHPGGGKMSISLTKKEAANLMNDLRRVLDAST